MPQLSEVTAPKPETENKERKQVIRFGHLNEPERLIRLNIFNASRAKIGASRTTLAGTDNGLTTWQDLREAGPSQAPVGTTENLLSFNGSRLGEQFLTQPVQFEHIIPNFLSRHTREWIDATPELIPTAEEGFSTTVMADVSGYSALTATLAERGPHGAELLGKTMKGYLDKIIQVVLLHGGDIVKFAGDAVIFYWKLQKAFTKLEDNERTRGELVLKAAICCLDLLSNLGTYAIDIPGCDQTTLRIHLGIGAGSTFDVHVGARGRWEHFIAGDAVNQLASVLDVAKAGELAMSHQALRYISTIVTLQSVEISDYDKRCVILTGLENARRKVPPPTPTANDELALWDIVPPAANVCVYKYFINENALYKLLADINQSRLFKLDLGLQELLSSYELRTICTVFIRIGSLRRWENAALLTDAQKAMETVLAALIKYEGSLRQFHVDEKGAVILCFFGLPPQAHENDTSFGIKAALQICSEFDGLFDDFSIGITTGVVAIGGVGNSVRTEYAVMGDSINMAARLMCLVAAKQSLLCDERSYNLSCGEFLFESLGETKVKGKAKPIAIFRPKATRPELPNGMRSSATGSDAKHVLIGRVQEKAAILKVLETKEATLTIMEGEGGQGLSTLVEFLRDEANKRNAYICIGSAAEMEKATPFFTWRDLFIALFKLIERGEYLEEGFVIGDDPVDSQPVDSESVDSQSVDSESIDSDSEDEPGFDNPVREMIANGICKVLVQQDLEKHFGLIFPNDYEEDLDTTCQTANKIRVKELVDLIIHIINEVTMKNHLILVFPEAQWMDPFSWELLWDVVNACPKAAVFMFTRPERYFENAESASIYNRVKRLSRASLMPIEGLSHGETRDMVLQMWSGTPIKTVSEKMASAIYNRTGGNPLYVQSLLVALKESGQWRADENGALTTQDGAFSFESVAVGHDLQSIIVAQCDKLDRTFLLFLKIASVFGQQALLDDIMHFLKDVPGYERIDRKDYRVIKGKIESLDKYGYLQIVENDGEIQIQFRSAMIRGSVYLLMVLPQRQQLHLNVAEYYEAKLKNIPENDKENRHRLLIVVFEHYNHCDKKTEFKMIKYLEQVSHVYFDKELGTETIKHYNMLMLKVDQLQEETGQIFFDNAKRAVWHLETGLAWFWNKDFDKADQHLLEYLWLTGHKMPSSPGKLRTAIKVAREVRRRYNEHVLPVLREEPFAESPNMQHHIGHLHTLAKRLLQHEDYVRCPPQYEDPDKAWDKDEEEGSGNEEIRYGSESEVSYGSYDPSYIEYDENVERQRQESIPEESQQAETPGDEGIQNRDRVEALLASAQISLEKKDMRRYEYCVLEGLNLSEHMPKGQLYGRFLAMAGQCVWLCRQDKELALRYLDAADTYDMRRDIPGYMHATTCIASTLFLIGGDDLKGPRRRKLETLEQLSIISGDTALCERAMRMQSMDMYLTGPKIAWDQWEELEPCSLKVSHELYEMSVKADYWLGKFWGSVLKFLSMTHLSEDEIQKAEMGSIKQSYEILQRVWTTASVEAANDPVFQLTKLAAVLRYQERAKISWDLSKTVEEARGILKKIPREDFSSVLGINEIAECLRAVETNKKTKKVVRKFEKQVKRLSKKMKAIAWGKPHADEKMKTGWKLPSVKKGMMEVFKKIFKKAK